jgi:hypothetical protein
MWKRVSPEWFLEPCWRVPALRPNRAEMSRAAFLCLVGTWSGAVSSLLLVMILIRVFRSAA